MMDDEQSHFTIYVSNIPPQLNENGLRELFSKYGEVRSVLQPKSSSWAYISYPSYKEAELATRQLNRAEPLELHIEVARDKEKWKTNGENLKPLEVPDFRVKNVRLPEPRAPTPHLLRNTGIRTSVIPHRPGADIECLYPAEVPNDQFDIYEDPDQFYDTNLMWCRGHTRVTRDGRRHVCMGRGYTWYELPPPKMNAEEMKQNVARICEIRNAQQYQYNENQLESYEGLCLRCKRPAKFQCYQCKGYYCSTGCQTVDWPHHQSFCKPMPQLISRIDNLTITETPKEPQKANSPRISSNESTPRPPYRNPVEKLEEKTNTSPQLKKVDTKRSPKEARAISITKSSLVKVDNKIKQVPEKSQPKFVEKPISQPEKEKVKVPEIIQPKVTIDPLPQKEDRVVNKKSGSDLSKTSRTVLQDTDFTFKKDTFLSSEGAEVLITSHVKDSIYWVQKVADSDELNKFMEELNGKADKHPKVKAQLNLVCLVQYLGLWHRCKIMSLEPLLVQYIDYGGENMEAESDDFRDIGEFKSIPQYAREVKFMSNSSSLPKFQVDETVNVIPVTHENHDGMLIVKIKGEENGVEKTTVVDTILSPVPKIVGGSQLSNGIRQEERVGFQNELPTSVISLLSAKQEGVLEVHTPLCSGVYSIALIPESIAIDFVDVLQKLPQIAEQILKEIKNYTPKVNEIVVGKRAQGDWIRGKVIKDTLPIKMAALDEGRVLVVEDVIPIPEKHLTIPAAAVSCELLESDISFEPGNQFNYIVTSVKAGDNPSANIQIIDENGKTANAIVRPWVPTPEQKGITLSKIKSGSKVCITTYRNHYSVFVRSLEKDGVEMYESLTQKIAKYSLNAKPLSKPPIQGEMVLAVFQGDENYYRAIVNEVKGNDDICVTFIDFGNAEKTSMKYLYEIPLEFKEINSCVQRVVLKDVPKDVPMNKEVTELLNLLTGHEQPLTMVYEGNPITDGVVLTCETKNVNKQIADLLVPSWEKMRPEEDTTCYMDTVLPVTKLGNNGDIVEVTVLYTLQPGRQYFVCLPDMEMMNHISIVLQEKINKYIESSPEYYIPRDGELCLAPFEGVYYRAVCLLSSKTPTTATVMYCDFGNIIEVAHKDIRMITKDFVEDQPLGCICDVENLLPDSMDTIPEALEKRLKELIPENDIIKAKIIGYDESTVTHSIELDDVKKKLVAEKLL